VPGVGELVVVDVGGATTDVYSVLTPDAERNGPRREAAGTLWRSRTVEADLGVRWSAPGVVEAAVAERLIDAAEAERLAVAAAARAADPALLPDPHPLPDPNPLSDPDFASVRGLTGRGAPAAGDATDATVAAGDATDATGATGGGGVAAGRGGRGVGGEAAVDARLAELAVVVALRRHARGERGSDGVRRGGKDLRRVRLVVGSGGVLRHAPEGVADRVLAAALADHAGGWPLPVGARRVVDDRYVLAAVGLLARDHPAAAARLARAHLGAP
jgi:hypothetical protein